MNTIEITTTTNLNDMTDREWESLLHDLMEGAPEANYGGYYFE